jgi:hypothetical protein
MVEAHCITACLLTLLFKRTQCSPDVLVLHMPRNWNASPAQIMQCFVC